jgi:predicted MFS family arabinose efflux permease
LQAPICLVAIIAVTFSLKLPTTDDSDWKTKLRRVDFLGALIIVATVFAFLLGMDRGSNVSWQEPITIVSLVLSLILGAAFLYVEINVASEPFAPSHIIFNKSLLAIYAVNFFALGTYMAVIFYFPLFFQAADGVSATGAGIRILPSIVAGVTGSLLGGIMMRKTGKYYWLTVNSYALMAVGVLLLFLCSGAAVISGPGMVIGLTLTALGSGIGITTTLISLSMSPQPMYLSAQGHLLR